MYTLKELLSEGKEVKSIEDDVELERGYRKWSLRLDMGKDNEILGRDVDYEKEIYEKWGDE